MVNENVFRLKKDGTPYKGCFCANPELIENYDLAMNDKTQTWHCHHRNEQYYKKEDLIKMGLYYDCPPCELIFLTREEHRLVHKTCIGYYESIQKQANTLKGHIVSEDTRQKLSKSLTGRKKSSMSEETKRKLSEAQKGRHWRLENGKRIWY